MKTSTPSATRTVPRHVTTREPICSLFFFFQAEDGIRDYKVTGVQTCALPILLIFLENAVANVAEALLQGVAGGIVGDLLYPFLHFGRRSKRELRVPIFVLA